MKKINPVIIIVMVIILIGTSACTRAAYKAPVTNAQATATLSFPVSTQPNVISEVISGTNTALAAMGTFVPTTQPPAATQESQATAQVSTAAATNTAAPTIQVPTPTPGLPETYTLHKGESVYCLSRRFNLSPIDLLGLNGLTGYETLPVGYELKIPSGSEWNLDTERSLLDHPTQYTVVSGDTIYTVACAFGDVDPNAIIFANNLSEPYDLTPGQTIHIP
ncbi:MAG: LysM peptidoglycan-binding domain-containing protein [bacterium]